MKRTLKKTVLMLLVFALSIGCGSAWAEEMIGVIMNAGTTQAFTEDAIPEDDLNMILEAGLSATSAINQQPWFFAVVTNQEVMQEISGGANTGMPAGQMPQGMNFPEGMEMPEGMQKPDDAEGMPSGMPGGAAGGAKAALGDSPVAVIIYMDENTSSPNASFDCGLACQNMAIAANALGYGTKIISSPTMALNGENHDALCEKLGVDPSLNALAVLLIGTPDTAVDGVTGASVRSDISGKVSFVD